MTQFLSVVPLEDIAALVWFLVCWTGYSVFADHLGWRRRPMAMVMQDYRVRWMERMLERDNRMPDINIVVNHTRSASLLVRTSILVAAGVIAIFGALDEARAVVSGLSFSIPASRELWEIKLFVLLLIFVYAFFKMAWCLRQFNFALVLIGAAPAAAECSEADRRTYPARVARLLTRATRTTNRGLRAYYFGLATLVWFVHPGIFALTVAWVVLVLYRRDFQSVTLKTLSAEGGHVED